MLKKLIPKFNFWRSASSFEFGIYWRRFDLVLSYSLPIWKHPHCGKRHLFLKPFDLSIQSGEYNSEIYIWFLNFYFSLSHSKEEDNWMYILGDKPSEN